ncbi:hypothetical protein [Congregicoccus parvus]|uniref:hypothetical protein n=1 Tax=Congregicoccus parvus TaxID=3081749 RepID=UPI003FA57624
MARETATDEVTQRFARRTGCVEPLNNIATRDMVESENDDERADLSDWQCEESAFARKIFADENAADGRSVAPPPDHR